MEALHPKPKRFASDTGDHPLIAASCGAFSVLSVYGLYPLLGPAVLVVPVGCSVAIALLANRPVSIALTVLLWAASWAAAPERLLDTTLAAIVLNAALALALLLGVHHHRELARELQRREVSLRQTLRLAEAGAQVSRVTEAPLTPVQAASVAVRAVVGAADVDLVFLLQQDGERTHVHTLHRGAGTGLPPGAGDDARDLIRQRVGALYRPDYLNDVRREPDLAALAEIGVRGVALVPVRAGTGVLMVLVALRLHAVRPWWDDDRNLLEAVARTVRIAAERQAHDLALDFDANHDALTGLLNRRAFERDVQWEAQAGQRERFLLAVIDLDGLKRVNDTAGHARGDDLIRSFANLMREELLPQDSLYRLGGDEFALLLRDADVRSETSIREKVTRAEVALRAAGFPDAGASVGWALWPDDGKHAQAVLHVADERMYADKSARRAPLT